MFNTVKDLYLSGKLSEAGVKNAVKKNWITLEEAERILAMKRI